MFLSVFQVVQCRFDRGEIFLQISAAVQHQKGAEEELLPGVMLCLAAHVHATCVISPSVFQKLQMVLVHISAGVDAAAEFLPLTLLQPLDPQLGIRLEPNRQGKQGDQRVSPVYQGAGHHRAARF